MPKAITVETLSTTVFYLDSFKVDAQKNTISDGLNVHTLEPKVMQVLLVLAASAGDVVEQETLFSQVWPDSIFSSGSIRRCIAILRKILISKNGDDVIKTYPKKGYCLTWRVELGKSDRLFSMNIVLVTAFSVLVIFLVVALNFNSHEEAIAISEAIPITSSEHQEFNAKLSPSGSNIAFLRFEENDLSKRQLWLKDLASEKEIRISDHAQEFAWSPTGKQVAYTTSQEGVEFIHILTLSSLLLTKDVVKIREGRRISSLHWGEGNSIFALIKQQDRTRLTEFNLDTQLSEVIKDFDSTFLPYEISLNSHSLKMALAGFDERGFSKIKSMAIVTRELVDIATLDANRYFLSWHTQGEDLLLSDGRELFKLLSSGELLSIQYENYHFLQHPQFLPDGKHIVFSQGMYDVDISLANISKVHTESKLINSNTVDRGFSVSPDKRKIAYISNQRGYPQVYLYDMEEKNSELVYNNDKKLLGISEPIWSSSGKALAFSNYQYPVVVTLTGKVASVKEYEQPLGVVTDWYTNDSHLLIVNKLLNTLSSYDLSSEQEKVLLTAQYQFAFADNRKNIVSVRANPPS